ncbi:hypothetical protein DFQ28_002392 [Apophysomyces sp. BC1034]|nr:hypothetical protein DFQ30_002943 [Apophysomyces sp. BC1015]KAG0179174.1 hypothetical protein DFQ29_002429 [Apophysomyces sp. BC1021]KAG0190205.1 hypothetical protein DFQ28_002392 [Apophysomyces sp. BC1034]
MLYQFRTLVPATHQARTLGFTVTDKMYVYAAAAQIFFSRSTFSMVPCLCGLATGALYDSNVMGVKQWRFPARLRYLAYNYIPFMTDKPMDAGSSPDASEATRSRRNQQASNEQQQQRQRQRQQQRIPEESIDAVASMFPDHSRAVISSALARADLDPNRAAEILLSSQS